MNGLNSKWESFINVLQHFNGPSCIMLQETKISTCLKSKLNGYKIFPPDLRRSESIVLTAVDKNLSPVLIPHENDDVNIIVVEILVGNQRIRVINGYGPQETDSKCRRNEFWEVLESQVVNAKNEGCLIIIEMDANAKLGPSIIPSDPNPISSNGSLLLGVMTRQKLTCLNSDHRCRGSITRYRKTAHGEERSILDFVLVCEGLLVYFNSMVIDESRNLALTKFATSAGNRIKKVSDHNVIHAVFNLKATRNLRKQRREIFDFKNTEAQTAFRNLTENSEKLRYISELPYSPRTKSKLFFKSLNNLCHRSFKKIRISSGNSFNSKRKERHEKLFLKKSEILNRINKLTDSNIGLKPVLEKALANTETQIFQEISERNAKSVEVHVGHLDSLDGAFCQRGMWKVKNKLFPKTKDPPTTKIDSEGNKVTEISALKRLYMDTYISRLKHRKMKPQFLEIERLKEELWELRLIQLKKRNAQPWTISELKSVTKELKNNQCRDPDSLISEVFKDEVAGKDLNTAVLGLMNMILETFYIPEELLRSNITSIWKGKGSRMNLNNDRGIFTLSILRKILDKLLYMKLYPSVANGMSYSNIGAKKHKNVRDHLFIVYGIIHSVLKDGMPCIDLQIYDLVQAFDSLWLKDCMNDLFDILPVEMQDKRLALVYELNKSNQVSVKTPVGLSEQFSCDEIVLQGGGWGPIQCSVSIDKLGRICTKNQQHMYHYKNKVSVVPLAMIDDLLAIAPCGLESVAVNTFINVHIEMKKLTFHMTDKNNKSKCHKIHVGKENGHCPILKVHGTIMPSASHDTYLGDIISSDGKNRLNLDNRVSKGRGKVAEIIGMISKLSLGKHFFKIAILLRETLFLSSVLTNSEVWYRLSQADLNEIEALDRNLLVRISSLPSSTPSAALYLELGCMRIRTIIKARRVNYLHYLLTLDRKEMLSRFFWCQWSENKKHDWTYQVRQDLADLSLPLDLNIIKSKSKFGWKNLVKQKARLFEVQELSRENTNKSKTCKLKYNKLQMQRYLIDLISVEAKIVLKYRLRMSQYSGNFKGGRPTLRCPLCGNHDDEQDLSFRCQKVITGINNNSVYEDIFQTKVTKSVVDKLIAIEKLRADSSVSSPAGTPSVHQPLTLS